MTTRDDVPSPTGARLDLLKRLGYGELTHDSHVPFLSHLLGVRRLLVEWDERPAMCEAGLFHSAYGTEFFGPDHTAERSDVEALIGPEAEAIAHAWCTIRRDTIELTDPITVVDRTTDSRITLGDEMAADVATLWAADTVEQIARMTPEERAFEWGMERVLHLARPAARDAAEATMRLLDDR